MDFKTAYISAGNDYFAALERAAEDETLLKELMGMFLADESFKVMCEKIAAGETEAAFRAAHSLKGSSGMLGMTALYGCMVTLTDALRHGNSDGAKKLLPMAVSEYEIVAKLIESSI